MCSLLAQLSTKSSLELPEAAYGAECDVVIMTRRPACLHAAKAFSNSWTSGASPLVISISKHTPG